MAEEYRKYVPRDNLSLQRDGRIIAYHRICEKNYDWRVVPNDDAMYYFDGDMPKLEPGMVVFNCNWTPEQWSTTPYKSCLHPIAGKIVKHYARYGLPPLSEYSYGYKREDALVTVGEKPHYMAMFRHNESDISAYWWLEEDSIWITQGGSHTHYDSGSHRQGATFSTVKPTKNPIVEPIMKAAKSLNSAKYNGFYKSFIEKLIDVYGLNATQI